MDCATVGCESATTGRSKYCPPHARAAREKWRQSMEDQKAEREERYERFRKIAVAADCAGRAAAEAKVPEPMTVVGQIGADAGREYHVPAGVCGFAWVTIVPGTCSFAHYAKKHLGAQKPYRGGMQIWVSAYGQSYERKRAYAQAYAAVLKGEGIDCYSGGRLD